MGANREKRVKEKGEEIEEKDEGKGEGRKKGEVEERRGVNRREAIRGCENWKMNSKT